MYVYLLGRREDAEDALSRWAVSHSPDITAMVEAGTMGVLRLARR